MTFRLCGGLLCDYLDMAWHRNHSFIFDNICIGLQHQYNGKQNVENINYKDDYIQSYLLDFFNLYF